MRLQNLLKLRTQKRFSMTRGRELDFKHEWMLKHRSCHEPDPSSLHPEAWPFQCQLYSNASTSHQMAPRNSQAYALLAKQPEGKVFLHASDSQRAPRILAESI